MHPAYSVILFTTASGAGYGLLALLGLVGFNHGPASSFAFGGTAVAISLGLITIGLLSSTFHLGHPERAWRAFSQWRSSWLSREGVVSVATYVPALLFAAAWLDLVALPIGPLGIVTALMCALTVFCTAKIYSTLKTIRQWHHALTVPVYLAAALATGAALLMAIASLFDRWQVPQAAISVAAIAAFAILKLLYWRAIDGEERTVTMGHATGLGGDVRQWEVPHTSRNFIQDEMGYAIARKHAAKLRMIVLTLMIFALAAALLTIATMPAVFAIASALALVTGTVVERWLFFAEAQHVVTLYYGAERA
jgi:sulfite dehydrogenase (quinone) subunit SoeC